VLGIFQDSISWTISPGWFWTMTILIFASQIARILGVFGALENTKAASESVFSSRRSS
jgi:hypothetical protein